jgi:hypothetical protein
MESEPTGPHCVGMRLTVRPGEVSRRALRLIDGARGESAASSPSTLEVSVFQEVPQIPLSAPDEDCLPSFPPQVLCPTGCDRGASLTDVREGCLLGREDGGESAPVRDGEPRGDAMRLLGALL